MQLYGYKALGGCSHIFSFAKFEQLMEQLIFLVSGLFVFSFFLFLPFRQASFLFLKNNVEQAPKLSCNPDHTMN